MRTTDRDRAARSVRAADGRHGARRESTRTARLVVALAVALVAMLAPSPADAQEEELDVPAMAEAPRQFHLGVSVSGMSWSEPASPTAADPEVDGGALFGLDVERLLTRFASVRLAGAYGSASIAGGGRTADVNAALFELSIAGRVALSSLRRVGVVPFARIGVGSVVFDPEGADLPTNSQNALSYGGGVEVHPLPRVGFRAEWRHYTVELENLFDPTDRTGSDRDADRFQASVFWTF